MQRFEPTEGEILFASVWEDYESVREALEPAPTDVALTICSAGDNAFNLIADGCERVIAIDSNDAQVALARRKLRTLIDSSYDTALAALDGSGLDAQGRFERLVVRRLRRIGPFTLPRDVLHAPVSTIRRKRILARRRALLTLASWFASSHELARSMWGDGYDAFTIDTRAVMRANLEAFVLHNDFERNPYLRFLLEGRFGTPVPYLDPERYAIVRERADRLSIAELSLQAFLGEQPAGSIDVMNLSDVFDWFSTEQTIETLRSAHAALAPGGRIFFRELFVHHDLSPLADRYGSDDERAEAIRTSDGTPFYSRFVILKKR